MAEATLHNLPPLDLATPDVSDDEKRTLNFCLRLVKEAADHKTNLGIIRRSDEVNDFLKNPFPGRLMSRKPHRPRVALHKARAMCLRQVGMLTEARPKLDIQSKSGKTSAANVLREAAEGIWWEQHFQQKLTNGLIDSQKHGYAACYVAWDKSADGGRGDIAINFLDHESFLVDPMVRHAEDIQKASYVIIKVTRPLPEFWEMYGERGRRIKPEYDEATAEAGGTSLSGIQSPLNDQLSVKYRRPSRRQQKTDQSAIGRATEFRLYLKDHSVDPEKPWIEDQSAPDGRRPNFLFPGKRVLVWAGSTMLYDGPSQYWDGMYPVEVLDWGMETDHPYGESEFFRLMPKEKALNSLSSSTVANAALINDPPWKVPFRSMTPSGIQDLQRYADQPGYAIQHKANYQVMRDPPGAYTDVVFHTMEYLTKEMEVDSGVVDVSQGIRPPSLQSGIAIDSLNLAAQTPIRHQGRKTEDFMSRVGQLVISRILQFYTDQRIMRGYGPDDDVLEFTYSRQMFLLALAEEVEEEKRESMILDVFHDFQFHVIPKSSLAIAKQQKLNLVMQLNAEGKVSDEMVLDEAGMADPKKVLADAHRDKLQKAVLDGQAQLIVQGLIPPSTDPATPPGEAPQTPASQAAGVGVSQTDNQAGGAQSPARPSEQTG